MKKIILFGLILTLVFTVSAQAQVADGSRYRHQREVRAFRHGDLNRPEMRRLHRDEHRYRATRRRIHHDGRVTPFERRHLKKMQRHNRRELYRFRHNRIHRVI